MTQVPYWKPSKKDEKTSMSVSEMRRMLGLSKGEGYYLVHTGKFKVSEEDGEYRIDIESFEKWYANQVNFSKVEGPPPGEELRKNSYSVRDISEILGIGVDRVLEILKWDKVETFTVDLRKHVTKENFEKWYHSQTRYRTAEDREETRKIEEDSIWLPDMARMLGIGREQVYSLVKSKEYQDFNLVITGPLGMPTEGSTISSDFQKLIEKNDLPRVVFHSLRHTSITYKLKLNGGDIKSVQGDSGHAQVSMVTDVYSHILDEDRKYNAQKFEEEFYSGKTAAEKKSPESEKPEAETSGAEVQDNAALLLKLLSDPNTMELLKILMNAN